MSKESFMSFARTRPSLAREVLKGNVSWQQLYELYEIYGEDNKIWNTYTNNDFDLNAFKDVFNMIKKIDLNNVQSGIANIQKTIGLLQDIGIGKTEQLREPIYKRFE